VDRGHEVHVLGDPTLAAPAEAAGCSFSSWERAPHRMTHDVSDDLLKDWEADDPLDTLRNLRITSCPVRRRRSRPRQRQRSRHSSPTPSFWTPTCSDRPLPGRASLPTAALIPNIWEIPTPGTGERAVLAIANRVVKTGLPDLNAARAERGLPPLTSFYDQILELDRILVLSSETFDPVSPFVPSNVRYVGPILDDPLWVEPWTSPWPDNNTDPLVLVGFTSVYQNQGALLQRVINVLSSMKCGSGVARPDDQHQRVGRSDNVAVVQSVPHTQILRQASAVVSHCGHGTTMKTLAAGVPMVCIPMGRDQDGTAERVVRQGAGIQIPPTASSAAIQKAIRDVLDNEEYKLNAVRLASILASEHQPLDVVLELEQLVGLTPTGTAL